MLNYEIGGNEQKIDTSESLTEIAHNKTLFIQKLTDGEAIKPEKIEGLKTVREVFQYFQPKVKVSFEKQDGSSVEESLSFHDLGDFSVKNIINQSNYLTNVNIEKEMSLNIIKQLKSNKTLKSTLDNAETKSAFINALKNIVDELEENK